LLVDRAHFPRPKVCGCCINPAARAALERAGISTATTPLTEVRLATRRRTAHIALHGWAVSSREHIDAALVQAAVRAGAVFDPGANVTRLTPGAETIRLQVGGCAVEGAIVVAADGLSGTLAGATRIRAASRVGAGAAVDDAPDGYEPGRVYMACHAGAYVGLVRLEDGRLNVAAAFDPGFLREWGRPAAGAARVLQQAGWPAIPALADAAWRGTVPLTRTARRPAGYRLFAVGDAAGYVEPFTGEGIAWALAAGEELGAMVPGAWSPAAAERWAAWCRASSRRRRFIRVAAWVLRRPNLATGVVRLAAVAPAAAGRIVAGLVTPGKPVPPPPPVPDRIPA
jgi:flavin-dependent dehydrogenase